MNTDYRYQLETPKLTGRRQQKTTCPSCGKKKCFVRYVDTQNGFRYVADEVGKCDHQHSCGYHYKPSEYYRDNRWAIEPAASAGHRYTPPPLPPFQPIPMEYVVRSRSGRSTFWRWFSSDVATRLGLTQEQLRRVHADYLLGATRRESVIFWQIDEQERVHAGHIMEYGADGHRSGFQGWTHTPLIRAGVLPPDYDFEAHKKLVPMQPGDVPITFADTSALERDYGFRPSTPLRDGLRAFAEWYAEFYDN